MSWGGKHFCNCYARGGWRVLPERRNEFSSVGSAGISPGLWWLVRDVGIGPASCSERISFSMMPMFSPLRGRPRLRVVGGSVVVGSSGDVVVGSLT